MLVQILAVCLAMLGGPSEEKRFEELFQTYRQLMYSCAYHKLQDPSLAEDAVNLSFLHVAKNMHRIEEINSARTKRLLVVITERTAINLYKKRQKELQRTVSIEEAEQIAAPEGADVSDWSVAEAMLRLQEEYREALLLKYSQGYHNREIAAILKCSVAKVEKLLSRGKRQLETILEAETDEIG